MKNSKLILHINNRIRIINALILREIITRYGRDNLGFLWLFIEPIMFSVGVAILWNYAGHVSGVISPAGFALTGYSSLVLWRGTVNRLSYTVSSNKGLLYHRKITVLDLLLSRGLLEILASSTAFIILTLFFIYLSLIIKPDDLLKSLVAWILFCWFVLGAGFIAAFIGESSEVFDKIWHVLMYLTVPLTGTFVMVDWLPVNIQKYILLSPLVHGVEMLREGFFGDGVKAHYSVYYILASDLIVSLIGLILIRKIRRNLIDD